MKIKNIVIIGAGNLAHQLVPALQLMNFNILQVYNRSKEKLISLKKLTRVDATNKLQEIKTNADLYIVCIKDDAIKSMASKMIKYLPQNSFVVHTSGVKSIDKLSVFSNHGLFYPLHSFSIGVQQSFNHLPIIIHANTDKNINSLNNMASLITNKVYKVDDTQRPYLHLAAVLVNNFTNHLLGNAFEILNEHKINLEILHPIIKEATEKALLNNPYDIQTGPAIRKDDTTIDTHIQLLKDDKLLQQIYLLISKSIQIKSID